MERDGELGEGFRHRGVQSIPRGQQEWQIQICEAISRAFVPGHFRVDKTNGNVIFSSKGELHGEKRYKSKRIFV